MPAKSRLVVVVVALLQEKAIQRCALGQPAQRGEVRGSDEFVRVQYQNPVAACLLQGVVACGGVVIVPGVIEYAVGELGGDAFAAVSGAGVYHNQLVDVGGGSGQAVVKEKRFVLDDHAQ